MKNIRKIVAILAAVLMMCSLLPISAFAAAGDVAVDVNFDSGLGGFQSDCSVSADDGYLTFDANGADWANTYLYANNVKADTHYVVTFKAKADKDCTMNFKINNGWAGDVFSEKVDVTTEWQDYEISMSDLALTATALVMFTSGYPAGSAPIYNIDDVKIVEVVDPDLIGKIVNADFETGDNTGWETHQSTVIDAEAAYDSSYGAHLIGGGTYGGLLNQTVVANAGKSYEISFWLKVAANGVNLQIIDGSNGSGTKLTGEWFDTNKGAEWKQYTYIVTPTQASFFINFCGAGNGIAEDAYVDGFTCMELIDPSYDGYLTNGDFETGKTDSWESVWGAAQISIVEGRNGGSAMLVNAGQWQVVRQKVTVEPNTDYVLQTYAKNASNMTLLVKDGGDTTNIAQAGLNGGDEWTQNSLVFNSGSYSEVYICVMGNVAGATAVVDDFFMFKKVPESNDGYIVNGTFETGALTPWNNLWGACPKAEVIRGGYNDNFALEIVSGQWKHVRQLPIAVEANTDYKLTVYAKNVKNMNLLVKDSGDAVNLANVGVNGGEDWTENVVEFNSGDYTAVIVSFMGGAEEAYGTFDNIVMEKVVAECAHEYFSDCDTICMICGEETRPEAAHNVLHVEAVEATCSELGNIEYWYCDVCGMAWLDEACTLNTNMMAVKLPMAEHEYFYACDSYCMNCGEETNPDAAHNVIHVEAKEAVSCIEYGNKEYWYCDACGTAWLDANLIRQTNMMSVRVAGECISDSPICQDGVCINCGLPCSAEAEHTYDDDYDADCNVCGDVREVPEKPVDAVYGDADGDGEITLLDATLIQQYLSGYDVTLGPVEEAITFNDGVLGGW